MLGNKDQLQTNVLLSINRNRFWNEVPPRRNCFSEEEIRGLMAVEGQ